MSLLTPFQIDGATKPSDNLSFSKLMGKPVADLHGYISHEFGHSTPVFKISTVVFADGTSVWVEGEHDLPYIPAETETQLALWNDLYERSNA